MNNRMAMAEKLSIPQLQQAIQSGSLPAYVGIPLLQEKMRLQKAGQAAGQQPPQSSIAEQVLGEAQAMGGVDQLPSNLPTYDAEEMGMAGGGIVAFSAGDLVEDPLAQFSGMTPETLAADQARIDKIKANETPKQRKEREQRERDRQAMGDTIRNIIPATKDIATLPGRAVAGAFESGVTRPLRAVGVPIPYLPESFYGGDRTSMTPFMDKLRKETAARATPQTAPPAVSNSLGSNAGPEYEPGIVTAPGQRPPQAPPQGAQPGINTLAGARPSTGTGQPSAGIPPQMANTQAQAQAQPESAMDRYARMLEAQGDDSAKLRKEAQAMALIQMGLGIAGGTSPNAFANIAQGALPAIQSLQQTMQGLRKDDRDRIKQLMEMGVSKEKLALEVRKLGIEDKKADALLARYSAVGGSKNELTEKQERELYIRANTGVSKVRAEFNKATSDPTYRMYAGVANNPKAKPEQREKAQAYINNINSQFEPALREAEEIRDLYRPRSMGAPGGTSAPLPMPQSKNELRTDGIYNTARGPAKWDGQQFIPVR